MVYHKIAISLYCLVVSKEEYERRKRDGICTKCGNKNDTSTVLCSVCREKAKKIKNKSRKSKINAGVCITCGMPKNDDRQECDLCRENRNKGRKRRKLNLIKNGICTECRKKEATEDNGCCFECSEKRKKIYREQYQKKKDKRKCVTCGCDLPDGYELVNCESCEMVHRENRKKDYHYFLKIGVCPRCRKEPIFLNEKMCFECAEKERNRDNKKGKYNYETYLIRMKRYKENGLCRQCGKKAVNGKTYCLQCLVKKREREKNRRKENKGFFLDRSEMASYGMCYFCGEPVKDGKKVCETHYDMCMIGLEKAKEVRDVKGHVWNQDNKLVFRDYN